MSNVRNWVASITLAAVITAFSASFPVHGEHGGNETLGKGVGKIIGYKFNDLNGNGIDNGEPRLEGFTILLSNLGPIPISKSTVTDLFGEFAFKGLPLQEYEVCEVPPLATPPWIPTTPTCVTVSLFGKAAIASVFFGNQQQDNGNGGQGCTRTQGFWGSSPAGQALVPILVPGTMSLGNVPYTAAQLDDILDQPVQGNALLILAHQLIAAKLNILAGAAHECIDETIAQADSAVGNLVVPPVGNDVVTPNSTLGQTMTALGAILDQYNQGNSACSPHCP